MSIWMRDMGRSKRTLHEVYVSWLRRNARWQVAYMECRTEGREVSLAPAVWRSLNEPRQGELVL